MWRRYEFPSRRIALDFLAGDRVSTVVGFVDLSRNIVVPLTEQDWTHLVERVKYMRALAIPQPNLPDWPMP